LAAAPGQPSPSLIPDFRAALEPQSREELANEIRALMSANTSLRERVTKLQRRKQPPSASKPSLPSLPAVARRASSSASARREESSDGGLMEAAAALENEDEAARLRAEAAHLRTAVEARDALLGRQSSEIGELERRVDELRG